MYAVARCNLQTFYIQAENGVRIPSFWRGVILQVSMQVKQVEFAFVPSYKALTFEAYPKTVRDKARFKAHALWGKNYFN